MDKLKDSISTYIFGISKSEYINNHICICCKQPIVYTPIDTGKGSIYSTAGSQEYNISGMCEHCFDAMFSEE